MIIATSFGPYTYVSALLLIVLPPVTAFVIRNRFRLSYRILAVLIAYTAAFVVAIDLGDRRYDMVVYDTVEFLRYESVNHFGDPLGFYLRQVLFFAFLIAPMICGLLIVAFPRPTAKYLHVPILLVGIALVVLAVLLRFNGLPEDSLAIILIATAYFVTWLLMKWCAN